MDPVLNIPENAASQESNQAVVEKTSGADEHALQTPRSDLEMAPVLNIPENAASQESNQAVVEKTSDEKRNPKLEDKQARKLLWGGSNANVICTPKTDDDCKKKVESCLELLDYLKTVKPPSGVRFDPTKITISKGLYREGVDFEKTKKVLGKGNNAGEICVVKDIKTGHEHALKKMMLPEFQPNEIRCWIDMSDTGLTPRLYLFAFDGNQVNMHMEILENAMTLERVIDNMPDFNNDAALQKLFSLLVLDVALEAVSALHSKGWTHNDLHGGNVMLQKSSPMSLSAKSLDFGNAKKLEGQTGQDSQGFRKDVLQIVRLFLAIYTGQGFNDLLDLQNNWKSKLEELTSPSSESDRDELFCLIKDGLDIFIPPDVESFRKKVKDKLNLAMGDTQTTKDNMRRLVDLLFPSQEDKTGEELAADLQSTELSTSLLSIKLKSNKERESVPQDVSCMGVEHHPTSEQVDASQEHERNDSSADDPTVPTCQEQSARTSSSTFRSMKRTKTQQQQKKFGGEVSTSLSQEENRKKDTEFSKTIDQSTEQSSERATLTNWLCSVVHEGPKFKSFATDMMCVSLGYPSQESVLMARSASQLQQPDDRSTTSIPDMTMNMDSVAKDSTSDK